MKSMTALGALHACEPLQPGLPITPGIAQTCIALESPPSMPVVQWCEQARGGMGRRTRTGECMCLCALRASVCVHLCVCVCARAHTHTLLERACVCAHTYALSSTCQPLPRRRQGLRDVHSLALSQRVPAVCTKCMPLYANGLYTMGSHCWLTPFAMCRPAPHLPRHRRRNCSPPAPPASAAALAAAAASALARHRDDPSGGSRGGPMLGRR